MALNDLGRGRMARNRYDEALQYFDRVMAMPDASEWSIYALSSRNAGSCYQRLGQFDRAVALQEKALAIQERRGKREYFVQALGRSSETRMHCAATRSVRSHICSEGWPKQKCERQLRDSAADGQPRPASRLRSAGRWDDAGAPQPGSGSTLDGRSSCAVPYHLLNSALIAKGRERFDEANELFSQCARGARRGAVDRLGRAFQPGERGARAETVGARRRGIRGCVVGRRSNTRRTAYRTDDKVAYLTRLITFYQEYVSALISQGPCRSRARGRRLEPRSAARGTPEDGGAWPCESIRVSARRPRIGCGHAVSTGSRQNSRGSG